MKKFVITLALLLVAGTMFAQEVEKGSKQRWRNFETNRFIDNWEISVGAGVQMFFGTTMFSSYDDLKLNPEGWFGKDLTLALDASLTKWVTPIVGFRLGAYGFNLDFAGFTSYAPLDENSGKESEKYDHRYWTIHADAMFNLTNWICRYKADRFYNAIFFVGFGFSHAQIDQDAFEGSKGSMKEFAVPFGLINRFRLCDAWSFNIELRDQLSRPQLDETYHDNHGVSVSNRWILGNLLSATAGFTYKFPAKRNFNVYTPIDKSLYDNRISALERDLQNANDQNAEYQKAIERYKKQLSDKERELQEALRNAAKGNPIVQTNDDVTLSIFFPIGKSEISDKNEINIKYMADVIKASNRTYTITGYADADTGTEQINMELSQQRAEAVYNALINAGVDSSKLKVDYKGCAVQPFDKAWLNRVAIIK